METKPHTLPRRSSFWILFALILLLGLALRVVGLDGNMSDYHPTRNYRAAIGLRYYYYTNYVTPLDDSPIDTIQQQWPPSDGIIEPPLVEVTGAFIYSLVGGEQIGLLRGISAVFYVIGGVFVCLTAYRLYRSEGIALFSIAFFLLIPYGVTASRTLQLEPFMLMMLCIALYVTVLYHDSDKLWHLILLTVVVGLVLYAKPVGAYFVYFTFIALDWKRRGGLLKVINWRTAAFGLISFAPAAINYGVGYFTRESIQGQVSLQFVPSLLLTQTYYSGLFTMIDRVVGAGFFIAAIFSLLLLRNKRQSTLLLTMWLAYVVFILTFTYASSTHSYYHLYLIVIVALSLGPLAVILFEAVGQRLTMPFTQFMAAALLILIAAGLSNYENWWRYFWGEYESDDPNLVNVYETVGGLVDHSDNVVYLADSYGTPLEYYAIVNGHAWTSSQLPAFGQDARLDTAEELRQLIEEEQPDYFIITQMTDYLYFQDELRETLADFPIVAESPQYIVIALNDGEQQAAR